MDRKERLTALEERARTSVLVIDGGWGTEIQNLRLSEEDYQGERFKGWNIPLKGDTDVLNLTRPDVVAKIHAAYFEAGADFAESNTFTSTAIAQADYGLQDYAPEMAREGARIARAVADEFETAERPRAVFGAIGPTNKTLSISPDVNDPGFRDTDFDAVRAAYRAQADAMAEFVDFFVIETVFDTMNAKAAIKALHDRRAETGEDVPIIVSGTITDASGRTLSGQTTEAFWNSVRHARPWAVGLNCALGAEQLRQYVAELARIAETRVIAYPNAGLPNAFGEYDETPKTTAAHLGEWARAGLVNAVGGCCGTRPDHIKAIAEAVASATPRAMEKRAPAMRLSGLEPFELA